MNFRNRITVLTKKSVFVTPILCLLLLSGCSTLASRSNTGTVVSRSAQIRSSTAVVAADLLEVSRGDSVDILDSIDVPDPLDNTKRERWFRVRARDPESTEGWIEARNVMPEEVLSKSRKLADDDKGSSPRRRASCTRVQIFV